MKIRKPFVTWEEFEGAMGGEWSPVAHTHVKADITDTPWAWADVSKAGSNLTDLATRQHAGLTNVTSDQHHAQLHAAEHEVGGGDLLAFADIPDFGDWLDQAVKQASSPTFVTAKLTALTDGYVPYHIDDATGLANSPIFTDGTKIGIGTTGLARGPLHLHSAGVSSYVHITSVDSGVLATDGFSIGYADDNAVLRNREDTDMNFYTNNALRMTIDNTGDVGIGKVPTEKLDVDGIVKADNFYLAAGITPNLGWLSDVVLGTLEEGETIAYDQATAKFIDAWGIDYDNPRLVYKMYTDFFSKEDDANDPWIGLAFGGGSATVAGTSNHPGIIKFTSNVTNSGYRFLTAVNCILIAGAEHSEFCFRTGAVQLNVRVRLGFQDSLSAALPTDGVYIDVSGVTLTGKTRNNGAGSTTGTSHALAANTWYRAKIAVKNDATLVTYILYSAAGVVLWTNTLAANIPTAAGRETGHGIVMYVAANVARTFDVDMMIATRAGYITR